MNIDNNHTDLLFCLSICNKALATINHFIMTTVKVNAVMSRPTRSLDLRLEKHAAGKQLQEAQQCEHETRSLASIFVNS